MALADCPDKATSIGSALVLCGRPHHSHGVEQRAVGDSDRQHGILRAVPRDAVQRHHVLLSPRPVHLFVGDIVLLVIPSAGSSGGTCVAAQSVSSHVVQPELLQFDRFFGVVPHVVRDKSLAPVVDDHLPVGARVRVFRQHHHALGQHAPGVEEARHIGAAREIVVHVARERHLDAREQAHQRGQRPSGRRFCRGCVCGRCWVTDAQKRTDRGAEFPPSDPSCVQLRAGGSEDKRYARCVLHHGLHHCV